MADVRQRVVGQPSSAKGVQKDGDYSGSARRSAVHASSQTSLLMKLAIICFLATLILLFTLFILYNTSNSMPVAFSLADPPRLEGPLEFNTVLQSAERLFEGKLHGPESIVRDGEHIYTGTADGLVLHIHKGEIRTLAQFGRPPCGTYEDEPTCGRPLGMRLDPDGYLIVCDTYYGLYKVNVATGDYQLLLPSNVLLNGQKLNFLNDLDISTDGYIYISDSSVYQRRDYSRDVLDGRGTGRLLRYDPLHNTTEILVDRLYFVNGVQLSRYEDFILFSETTRARVLKYNLKGVHAGELTVFADNLPCLPDNIRPSSGGGFWIACSVTRYEGKRFNSFDFSASRPWLRWIMLQLPSSWFVAMSSPSSMLIELNSQGKILRMLMDPDGQKLRLSSEVEDDNGVLYIGSFSENYIARVNINQRQATVK